jgi:arginine utilization protein RocB
MMDDEEALGSGQGPARVKSIADQLVAWPSETGTTGEVAFAERLRSLLRAIPYFSIRPDHVVLLDSHGTPVAKSVVALVRGRGRRCVALAGHYDTVGIGDYGDLAPVARDPEALAAALIADLAARPITPAEQLALDDLRDGAYRAGRGMLDMKSGDAAGIAALHRFSDVPNRHGNLLLLLTPDEENRSRGMRSLRDALPDLARRWGLDIVAGINLDAVSDAGDGSDGRSIHVGTVGKLLPFAFVIGQPTHAGYPFDGISAPLIGAEIIRAVEANMDLCDDGYGERTPPPTCLEAKDMRANYSVTTPGAMWLAFNWLTHSQTPEQVLSLFRDVVQTAMHEALDRQAGQGQRFAEAAGADRAPVPAGVTLSFAALKEQARSVGGAAAMARHEALTAALAPEDNPLVVSRTLVADLVAIAQIQGPAVIVGFGSLYYPHTHVAAVDKTIVDAMRMAAEGVAIRHGTSMRRREFFAGISDMSFFGVRPDPRDAAFVAANTPAPNLVDTAAAQALQFPVVNIGPWGRDYHQRLERVHAAYAFEVLPDLLLATATAVLALHDNDPPVAHQLSC